MGQCTWWKGLWLGGVTGGTLGGDHSWSQWWKRLDTKYHSHISLQKIIKQVITMTKWLLNTLRSGLLTNWLHMFGPIVLSLWTTPHITVNVLSRCLWKAGLKDARVASAKGDTVTFQKPREPTSSMWMASACRSAALGATLVHWYTQKTLLIVQGLRW